MSFEVLAPGMLALLQDCGRYGHQHQGMTPGGPADEHAFLWANKLLANAPGATAIELTLGQAQFKAAELTRFALTGADMGAKIGNRRIAPWQTHSIAAGEVLSFGVARQGVKAYLAVPGGFLVAPHFGSTATVKREGLGGLAQNGQPLSAGDVIGFVPDNVEQIQMVPRQFVPDYGAPLRLRLQPAYQYDQFPEAALQSFFDSDYVVSKDVDRMGYRLNGAAIRCDTTGVISEGIAYGAVQIPADGQPIVLLSDRQTIGGYPKLGCIASLDGAALSQRRPGDVVRFCIADKQSLATRRFAFNRYFGIGRGN